MPSDVEIRHLVDIVLDGALFSSLIVLKLILYFPWHDDNNIINAYDLLLIFLGNIFSLHVALHIGEILKHSYPKLKEQRTWNERYKDYITFISAAKSLLFRH